ncbi:MAG: hypothetical protein E5W63_09505, partial [Mesorhizobium sp.]
MSTTMNRRSLMGVAGLYPLIALLPGSCQAQGGQTPAGKEFVLAGDYGFEQQSIRNLQPGATINARNASFTVANSRNRDPNAAMGCDEGPLPVNRYPVVIRNCPGVRFVGGRFDGQVPLTSDWRDTYCNSAALL